MPLPSLKNTAATVRMILSGVRWKVVLLAVAAIAAGIIAAAGLHTCYTRPAPLPAGTYTEAMPERKVTDIPRAAVPVKQVLAYDKAAIKKKLPLLAPELESTSRQVIANADIPATRGGASAVTVLDTDTGESRILVREKAPPLVEFTNEGAVGLRYGINEELKKEGTLYGRWNVLRIGRVHVGAYADVSTTSEATAQASIEYRW